MTVQPGLYRIWSETQIVDFLMHRLICKYNMNVYNLHQQFKREWFKDDTDSTRQVILNGLIKFSYFYLEDALTYCLCTEQLERTTGFTRLKFDLYQLKKHPLRLPKKRLFSLSCYCITNRYLVISCFYGYFRLIPLNIAKVNLILFKTTLINSRENLFSEIHLIKCNLMKKTWSTERQKYYSQLY